MRTFLKIALAIATLGGVVWLIQRDIPVLSLLLQAGLLAVFVLLLFLGIWRFGRRLLWRVGSRLAFSYFLIGVLPIPMLLLVGWISGYILNGFFLGHLYRDAVASVHEDLSRSAAAQLHRPSLDGIASTDTALALYRDGVKIEGWDMAPHEWPEWLRATTADSQVPGERRALRSFIEMSDGEPTLAAAVGSARRGALAVYTGDLEAELRQRSDVWIGLVRADAPDQPRMMHVSIGNRRIPFRAPALGREAAGRDEYFGLGADSEPAYFDRPIVWWGELSAPVRSLDDGSEVAEHVAASLNSSPRRAFGRFFSSSAEIDTAAWAALIGISGLLATIYGAAVVMALAIIIALSRAVNRLSKATSSVSRGDFSVRIPTKRRNQVGELQHNFNQMTEHLESLVETAAQKELVDKELSLARDLQESLLPIDLPRAESVEFATLFEPSAAIGGDYFDILRIDDDRLAVVIADVSGHGLPTGLRMAMIKAALVILVEESKPPHQIFTRLSDLIRSSGERRYFVTATIAVVDFRRGRIELTNAGHPPTYLLRGGGVEEILLPGPPLGTLGGDYGQHSVELEDGDIVVWLSDGLIEAANANQEPFGYERLAAGLEGPVDSPERARDQLLEVLARHTAGHPADDDRTLVAMQYRRNAPPTTDS